MKLTNRYSSIARHGVLRCILILTNLILFGVLLWRNDNFLNGGFEPFHEPFIVQIFLILNLPSMFLAGLMLIPMFFTVLGISPSEQTGYLQLGIWIISICIQWLVVGFVLEKILFRRSSVNSLC